MAEYTENYNLTKQGDNEYVGIDVMNDNLDIIDQAIAEAGNNPQLEIDVAEIKDKIGSTADTGGTKTTGTVMAKENAILEEVAKIGAPNDAGNSSTTGTTVSIFAKLNYLVSQVSSYLSNIHARIGVPTDTANSATSASAHGKLNWFLNLFGTTDDTGATEEAGTVLGKLNAILKQPKQYAMKTLNWTMVAGEVYEVTIEGKGVFYGMYSTAAQTINPTNSHMTIDGTRYDIKAGSSTENTLKFQPRSTGYGLYWYNHAETGTGAQSSHPDEYGNLEFSQGFTIQIKTTTAYPFVLHYSLLE